MERRTPRLTMVLALVGLVLASTLTGAAVAASHTALSARDAAPNLGSNVIVLNPSMPQLPRRPNRPGAQTNRNSGRSRRRRQCGA
jgi:hypothetical protein